MNAILQAQTAYGHHAQATRTERGIEYDAFARVTRLLREAAGKDRRNLRELAAALHQNRRLWTILAADVADANNSLPKDLRARIFYLAEFTRHHSRLVLNEGASIDVLIDVNTAIMRGLSKEGKSE